jgi:hypothetical protein
MIQLNKKQAVLTAFIVLHLVFFANLYYLLAFGVKTTAEVRSLMGGSEETNNKEITFKHENRTFTIQTNLDPKIQKSVPIVFSSSNPENFIALTNRNLFLGRVTMSILFGLGIMLLIFATFKKFVVFTIRFSPFYIGFAEKKWNIHAEQKLAKFTQLSVFETLPFVYYDFKFRNSTHFEGLYQSIIKDQLFKGNVVTKSMQVPTSKHSNKLTSKVVVCLSKSISELQDLTTIEQAILSLLENETFTLAELQLKMQQTFGKEYDKFNINLMNEYLTQLPTEQKNRLNELHQLLNFIETYPNHLSENLPNELDTLLSILDTNTQFLTSKTISLFAKATLSTTSKELCEQQLNILSKTGFSKW